MQGLGFYLFIKERELEKKDYLWLY
ncbi:MAG: hypothetical protein H6Q42_3838, partial [Deltaproteobacteria bacterium]|nr:hypothetical protein [Deltaproteobacteria bacterium]